MSHSDCPNCGKPRFDNHIGFNETPFHHDHKFDREGCFCESFVCDDRFKVRLGGLTGGLNFRLRQLTGCEVKMKVDCGEECRDILAEICFVGRDFVEVNVQKELENNEEEADEEILEEDIDEECPRCKKKHKRKNCKKCNKKNKQKNEFAIFPFETIKWFEIKEDCDCDCDCC